MNSWEYPQTELNKTELPYDYGIVLCGVITYNEKSNRISTLRSFDRVVQAIRLYKNNSIKKIVLSGGSGSLIEKDFKEAAYIKNYLVKIGIPDTSILFEAQSRNTYENALYTSKLLGKNYHKAKSLLITSGYHMRRAKACFKKRGFNITYYSTDTYSGEINTSFNSLFIPNVYTFALWSVLLKEYFGYIAYYFADYL